uniref:ZW10 interacting kinetochore protein n=1 Tax=Monodon monoceros TaxID=40151 RepID=A0A8C6CFK3_MONMO
VEDAQRKQAKLREALEQLQAKKQMAMEKLRRVQKQWQLQQEKRLQHLAVVSSEGKLLFHEAEAEMPQELDLPKDKPQQLTQPQEQNIQDTMGRDECVSSKANNPQPAGDTGLPWLPGRQQHGEGS